MSDPHYKERFDEAKAELYGEEPPTLEELARLAEVASKALGEMHDMLCRMFDAADAADAEKIAGELSVEHVIPRSRNEIRTVALPESFVRAGHELMKKKIAEGEQ